MKNKLNKPKGFIAIVSLLIVSTVAMLLSVKMLQDGVNNAALSLSSIYYEDARINTISCVEEMLLRIQREEEFSSNLNYTLSEDNSCSTTIQWFAPQQIAQGVVERLATMQVTGVSHGFTRHFEYDLKVTRNDVNYPDGSFEYTNVIKISSIQELAS